MSPGLELFKQLGNDIDQRWRAAGYATPAFADIAQQALRDHALPEKIDHRALVREALRSSRLPPQSGASFGQPPLNVYIGPRFYIEVLTWVDSTTSIHQHNFSGAFQVLAGSSMHTQHEFAEQERYGNRFLVGDTKFRNAEWLQRGQVRQIHSGARLIHALFHLDHPSATIVVRTEDDGTGPQYNYEKPHVALDPFFIPEPFRTQARLLQLLAQLDADDFVPACADALAVSDAWSSYRLLEIANRHLKSEQALEPLLDVVRARLGAVAERMRPCLAEARRQANIKLRRDSVRDPAHRFFLATLLNLPCRSAVLQMVQQWAPDADPIDWVVAQVSVLSQQDQIGLTFNDVSLSALEGLLRGDNEARIVDHMVARWGSPAVQSQQPALQRLFAEIRSALLLQPLFAEQA